MPESRGRSANSSASWLARDSLVVPSSTNNAAPASTPAADAPVAPTGADSAPVGKIREGTKQAKLIAMLQRPAGATIAEIVEATGWQSHTVRGALAGALKKKLGLDVASAKEDQRGRVYRIAD